MSRGTYIHTEGLRGPCFDGVPEGSSTKAFACEWRELGQRARRAIQEENDGDRLDRFLTLKVRFKAVR